MRSVGHESVASIQHDSYYHDCSHISPEYRGGINFDHPDALETSLLVQHLGQLKSGRSIEAPIYDFTHHTRVSETRIVQPRRVVLVEGILVLADQALRSLLDIRVYVDTDADLRILRRIDRDLNERGRTLESIVTQYLRTVRPMHVQFVEPSKRHAQVIIPGDGPNQMAVGSLLEKIRALVSP
jgi:uridine kinase